MSVSYDVFTGAFLAKVQEYDFPLVDYERDSMIDGFMKRAISSFRRICKYDLASTVDDDSREFTVDIPDDDLEEIADIISEGMLVQWMKPYLFKQENMENLLNTRDFSSYSPGELLAKIGAAHKEANRVFTNMMREYSFNHGDLSDLHI